MEPIKQITSRKIAYNLGFSDGLNRNTHSAYKDIMRWHLPQNIRRRYTKGYQDAQRLKKEVLQTRPDPVRVSETYIEELTEELKQTYNASEPV